MTNRAATIAATLSRPESGQDSIPPSPNFNRVDSPSQPRHRTPRVVKPKTNEDCTRIDDVNDGINGNHTSEAHHKMNNVHPVVQAALLIKSGVKIKTGEMLKINVSGRVFELSTRQVHRYPNSLLARPSEVIKFYEPDLGMFFFDRNRHCFEWIAQFYQGDGFMKFPEELPEQLLEQELDFWKIGYCDLNTEPLAPAVKAASIRSQCNAFFNDPSFNKWSKLWMIFDIVFILLSITLFMIKPEKAIVAAEENVAWVKQFFLGINIVCAVFFTTDLLARFLFCENRWTFFLDLMPWLDVLAIIPLFYDIFEEYLHMDGDIINVFKLFRMARVARCFKLIRRSKRLLLIFQILFECKPELSIMLMVWLTGTVISGSAMYYIEVAFGNKLRFYSILESCWWAVTTIGTVGYGNIYPLSPLGKVITSMIIFCSMIFMTVPMTIIIRRFSDSYEKVENSKKAIKVFGTNTRVHLGRSRAPSSNTENKNRSKWKSLSDRVTKMLKAKQEPIFMARGVA